VTAWALGAALVEASGLLVALVACQAELSRAYEEQTSRLVDSEVEVETAEMRERLRVAKQRVRRHDLANAVTAVEGAATILERDFDRLTPSDRAMLTRVLGSGSGRLRRLLDQESSGPGRVVLAETAAAVAEEPACRDRVLVEVPADLVACGSGEETGEAVRQLLQFACSRMTGGPVTLRGERDGTWAVLRVEDGDATTPRQPRRRLGDLDRRRGPAADDNVGLRVAARLIREQGGDAWVEFRSGGGTSLGICLPAAALDEEGPAVGQP
jgi:K+-sensing histidine kinase KdpD